jgi:hypothetical protein
MKETLPEGIRRSERVAARIPIQLVGADTAGQQFLEDTTTVMLSRYGAAIFSARKLSPEQEMIVRRRDTNREEEVRIVAKMEEQTEGFVYAVGFVSGSTDLWGSEFDGVAPDGKGGIFFACGSCGSAEVVERGEAGYGLLDESSGVLRYCMGCRTMTLWNVDASGAAKSAKAGRPVARDAERVASASARASGDARAEKPHSGERRKHSRSKAGVIARVSFAGFEEDVVCENISRGGICFKTRKRYFANANVEVAVPYSPNTQIIFVPATIIYVQELPEKEQSRCGLAYDTKPANNPQG